MTADQELDVDGVRDRVESAGVWLREDMGTAEKVLDRWSIVYQPSQETNKRARHRKGQMSRTSQTSFRANRPDHSGQPQKIASGPPRTRFGVSNGFSLELPTGATMYVERSGAGAPVVLIHGNFVSLRQWDPQLALADRLDLIRYDIRGFGRSPLGTGRYSDEADLAALLDALGIDSAHLVGTSYGGAVAIDFALRYPARVRSIVIVPGGIGGWEAPDWMFTGWDDFERALSAGDYSGVAAAIMAFPPMRPLETRPTLHRQVATMIEDHRWAEYGAPVEVDALDPPAATRLGEIQVPTLVLSGSLDDDAFLALGDRMAEEMSSAERLIIEGGSHLVWMEFPGEFNTEVADFIERQGSPSHLAPRVD